ncbi:PA2169 family four-helix-bundle protein [Fontimonas sp. SYSU GA230001]|uniref:PA2169 family four-helix-bundle protein n=1 Tax=Fontimonas sp. SYSU GA230001 TaxID=3142450 RepID=UPI0032B5F5E5
MSTVDTISMLNRLIVTEKNGEACLRAAAEEAHHESLRSALIEYSRFLGESAHELQDVVRGLGGHPREIGSFGNTLHRTWMHLKVTALGRDERVILDEVERDENEAETLLADAVEWDTTPSVHALLERQYEGARRRHQAILGLRAQLAS